MNSLNRTSHGHGEKRSRKQEILISALLTTPTVTEAATHAGVADATARRWLKDGNFQADYTAAKQQVVEQTISQLQRACCAAIGTLPHIMSDPAHPASVRVTAARSILETTLKPRIEAMGPGRTPEGVERPGPNPFSKMSDDDLMRIAAIIEAYEDDDEQE